MWGFFLSILLVSGHAGDRDVNHPYIYSHENPYIYEIRDLEEKYQRYTRNAEEYHEKAEGVFGETDQHELGERERLSRKRHYEELARVYEKKARRAAVELKRLYRYERLRQAEDRDWREFERLEYLGTQRILTPHEERKLESLRVRVVRRRSANWR
jgi:predicted RNase H-like nuclease (RuvC/YqgF family)